MLEQSNTQIIWYAHFTSNGLAKTGLTNVTVTVYKDDTATPEVNAASMSELADGFYYYKQTPTSEGFRVAIAKTADTSVDQRHLPAVMLIGKAGIEHLDASVSSRAADSTVAKDATVAKDSTVAKDATVAKDSTAAKESTLTAIKGAGWSSESDTLDLIREAVANVPAQRETEEL